ncbi:MAG: hypothetical protein HC813_00840 [Planctomycetes bacterium]|nr:hypothetical protein [Planctomycetota bacterium]
MRCSSRRALVRLLLGAALLCGCEPFGGTTTIVAGGPSVGLVADAAVLDVLEGESGSIGFRLSEDPRRTVLLEAAFASDAGPFVIASGASLTFDSSNWDSVQYVGIGARDDADTASVSRLLRIRLGGTFYMDIDLREVDQGAREPEPTEEDPPAEEDPEPTPGTPPPPVPPIDPGEPKDGVSLTVKDASGLGAIDYPITAVIPLSFGVYQETTDFRIVDGQGTPVPAQFDVLNRWWLKDNSIRHVAVKFFASVSGGGKAYYTFQTTGAGPAPAESVRVTETAGVITVDTGTLKFTVRKTGFNLFDEVWLDTNEDGAYAASERVVAPNTAGGPVLTDRHGAEQRAVDRTDLKAVVEESGPIRTVIRLSALTKFHSASDHQHGFAVRLFAYAGKSFVKVDYQLQNSAKNARFSGPLYFDDLSLRLKPTLSSPTLRLAPGPGNVWSGTVGSGRVLLQNSERSSAVSNSSGGTALLTGSNTPAEASMGWADLSDGQRGVFWTIRNMAEMWPNALEVSSDSTMAVRLWPRQSAQFQNGSFSSSGLYWLEDMQQVYKEALVYFHGANTSSADLDRLAATFQYHPVPFVPIEEYARTRVTLNLSGLIPNSEVIPGTDTKRIPWDASYQRDNATNPSNGSYNFGWGNFLGDTGRKSASGTGGVNMTAADVIATGRVSNWLGKEGLAIGDLNCRGQWLAEYDRDTDYALVQPTQDPYSGRSWRAHVTGNEPDLPNVVPYLPGTQFSDWKPRDNEHGWFYHIEDFYYLSANPWIRDWYEFIGEFRKTERSNTGLAYWSFLSVQGWETTRGEAHSIANAMQALRVTGDTSIMAWMKMRFANVKTHQSKQWGSFHHPSINPTRASVFEHGYLARALAEVMDETGLYDREVWDRCFNLIWGIVEWNDRIGDFAYVVDNTSLTPPTSAGSALPMTDPIAWFAWKFGAPKYLDKLFTYISSGLNGGSRPYEDIANLSNQWTGSSLGRAVHYVRKYAPTADGPAAVTNLTASAVSGKVEIRFTAPAGAKSVHVVWSTLPISRTFTREADKRNPWCAEVLPNTLILTPGSSHALQFGGLPSGTTVHLAVVVFDIYGHMSGISNVASVTAP